MNASTENKLEQLLRTAATEPAHRPEFYATLLDSLVYILGFTDDGEDGHETLEAGRSISIQHWERPDGVPVIPFFSSLAVVQESIDAEQSYIELPARALFEMTSGANLVLNPRSEFGKEFSPEEIAWLLEGRVGAPYSRRSIDANTNLILSEPSEPPAQLIDSLITLFLKHKNVNRAFLGLMHDPDVDEHPHLLIGIDAEGEIDRVFAEAGSVAVDTSPDGEVVDLVRVVEGDDGVSGYFLNNTKPFYDRSWAERMTGKGSA